MCRTRQVSKLIALSLVEIKPVYYPGEEKLVSLDVLKLYHGENVVRHKPNDVDPNRWIDEGELMKLPELPELPEVSLGERENTWRQDQIQIVKR